MLRFLLRSLRNIAIREEENFIEKAYERQKARKKELKNSKRYKARAEREKERKEQEKKQAELTRQVIQVGNENFSI